MTTPGTYDAILVGGGHNGLVAAAYLGKAGKRVLLLERLDVLGGAAISAQAFDGVEAWLSRYSYLVSLLPQRIIDDLKLDITLVRRRYSSYTPDPTDPTRGLLVDNDDAAATRASFDRIGAPGDEFDLFTQFYEHCRRLTQALWPTMTAPLLTRSEAKRLVTEAGGASEWEAMIETPIGEVISRHLQNDLVRGVVFTDALIGTFARAHDADLQQNICFLYHLIGGGTGDWDVPVGGMGAVSAELARAARDAGATLVTNAEVTSVSPDGVVRYRHGGAEHEARADWILSNVAPAVLDRLLVAGTTVSHGREQLAAGEPSVGVFEAHPFGIGTAATSKPNTSREGAQVKVNLLLKRLPQLRDANVTPEAAFGGTFHIHESWSELDAAYLTAAGGGIPSPLPCEIYCHSVADPTILSPELREAGAHTLTVFGLHTPARLVTDANNDEMRARLQAAVLVSLNSVLAEPIEDLLLTDATGRPCIETKTTRDIERAVGMPLGNIFHGGLDWPFAEDDARLNTPAERWGVATAHPRVLVCGSGARRGGAVSGIGGHNAAMALLESE
ncbi:phytoene desaturase family protein [Mycetocola zhadangensis]|uniref:NAD(P)/FAD-dependent oxidoreductase n=1 Tax=Mycetocola zhadangensis TaxID=1164595 RepID=A0A3L7J0F4_9MICO|nr:NAD(P)/FAD-dependent oxidoreductase [Mycetocola zhadangensis]RLQ83928.1 NAD(P)/FAD-dependent oxidoreductase [Mycetocola zhadangensis]GGE97625.1 phytoene dehydrogenase [Mycetocola zhadangensis]